MTEISAMDFTKLTIDDVSELLLDNLSESGKKLAGAMIDALFDFKANKDWTHDTMVNLINSLCHMNDI